MKEYAVYNAKTDELICMGTSYECTAYLGMKNAAVFYCAVVRSKKPCKFGRRYAIITVEEDGEE